jgi:SAM-dependent MidA family methyltransferase
VKFYKKPALIIVMFDKFLRQFEEFVEAHADELNPHRDTLQGRESAEKFLKTNVITNERTVRAAMEIGFGFSEFQQQTLFHDSGYFEKEVDYRRNMVLLPQTLTPFFGKSMAELAFALYVNHAFPFAPDPTFLSLGAGRAYLDRDLIEHITADTFDLPEYRMHAKAVRENSTFVVSDHGKNALALMRRELSDLLERMPERVRTEEIDALDFDMGNLPFGIVYSNELLDCLPTEPIIKIDGTLYAVKLLAYDPEGKNENSDNVRLVRSQIKGVKGLISKEQAKKIIERGRTESLRFMPVFIPLTYDQDLVEEICDIPTLTNIDKEEFGGLYPVQVGIDSLFKSVKKSFQKGILILIDYVSVCKGMHNWNKAVNEFRHYQFGKEDLDFQIDPAYIIHKAAENGMRCERHESLGSVLKEMVPLLQTFTPKDIIKWAKAQGMPTLIHPFRDTLEARMGSGYGFSINIADHYSAMFFKF